MLTIPVYVRGNTYYLHTRFFGKQFKKSLHTLDKQTAIIRASALLKAYLMAIDESKLRTYKLDLKNGIAESEGEEDHRNMIEAMTLMKSMQSSSNQPEPVPAKPPSIKKTGMRLLELLDKMLMLKCQHKPATVLAYKNTIKEFSEFLGNPFFDEILESDITRFQEYLASSRKNTSRTIDNKVATIRSLFNFSIKQKYYFGKNPAAMRALVSKREIANGGYAIFELPEVQRIFDSDYMRKAKIKDPDYYWSVVLATFSACRISEITSLTTDQIQQTHDSYYFLKIRDSKTKAGIREVPIPTFILNDDFVKFATGKKKLFKYKDRLGKGSGGAVSQKFTRHMEACNVDRPKLVLHSLRKFLNNYFANVGRITLEPRCQFMGHELENVNTELYLDIMPLDDLVQLVSPVQLKLFLDLKMKRTQF